MATPSVDLVSCSASNFADSAGSLTFDDAVSSIIGGEGKNLGNFLERLLYTLCTFQGTDDPRTPPQAGVAGAAARPWAVSLLAAHMTLGWLVCLEPTSGCMSSGPFHEDDPYGSPDP